MLLHTIANHNYIFPQNDFKTETVKYQNCLFEGFWKKNNDQNSQFCISRLISTNPADYLREEYSLGKFLPIIKK